MKREDLRRAIEMTAEEQFTRSGGPGGQNVNATSTQVVLRIPLDKLGLPGEELLLLKQRLATRINRRGELVIHAAETRYQGINRQRAVERALTMIDAARRRPRRRRPTRPGRAARERRLQAKRNRGRRKQDRRPPDPT